jgi:hypothetical protein
MPRSLVSQAGPLVTRRVFVAVATYIWGPLLRRSVLTFFSLCLDQQSQIGQFGGTRNHKGNQPSSNGIIQRLSLTILPITLYNGSLQRPVTIVVVVANTHVLAEVFLKLGFLYIR